MAFLKKKKQRQASRHQSLALRFRLSKGIYILSGLALIFGLGYGAYWLWQPDRFPITSVQVLGDIYYLDKDDLYQVSLPELKGGFFGLNVESLKDNLGQIPWVKRASVQRVWPGKLVLRIEEHTPAATWNNRGIISQNGVLIYPDLNDLKLNLPDLHGPDPQYTKAWAKYLAFEKILSESQLSIKKLELEQRGAWNVTLNNDIEVILGTNETNARLNRFVQAYNKELKRNEGYISYVDMRYTSGMAVGWVSG